MLAAGQLWGPKRRSVRPRTVREARRQMTQRRAAVINAVLAPE
jgi:hypothetical protein